MVLYCLGGGGEKMDPNLEKYSRHKSMYIGTVGAKVHTMWIHRPLEVELRVEGLGVRGFWGLGVSF